MTLQATTSFPANSTTVRMTPLLRVAGATLRLIDALSPRTASRVAANLFLTPRKLARPAREQRWAASGKRIMKKVAGFELSISTWGEGDALLLLHGWEGRGTQLGAFAERFAAEGYQVIAPDLPAHGDSKGKRTNLLEFAAVIRALIEEYRPAGIVAHSFGSAATTVALREIEFDGRLVYVAPPEDFAFFTDTFGSMLGLSRDLAQRMQSEIESRFQINWAVLRGVVLAPLMKAPLLVIHDDDDDSVPAHFGKALACEWPHAELLRTKGLGHRRILRDDEVIEEALRFLMARDGLRPSERIVGC